jgi:hypothetical protein
MPRRFAASFGRRYSSGADDILPAFVSIQHTTRNRNFPKLLGWVKVPTRKGFATPGDVCSCLQCYEKDNPSCADTLSQRRNREHTDNKRDQRPCKGGRFWAGLGSGGRLSGRIRLVARLLRGCRKAGTVRHREASRPCVHTDGAWPDRRGAWNLRDQGPQIGGRKKFAPL